MEVRFTAKRAMFTDPITRLGGEKCSYQIPTYEALKGMMNSIYWKPTFFWVIDECRIINPIKTESINMKNASNDGCSLNIYNYLKDVEYHVKAHIEWNLFREDLKNDRNIGKHLSIAQRSLEKGGRRDIFFGTRECQGDAQPCNFNEGFGVYDTIENIDFGFMFHGYNYPDETGKTDENGNPDEDGKHQLFARFWDAKLQKGIIKFPAPKTCTILKYIKDMEPNIIKTNGLNEFKGSI